MFDFFKDIMFETVGVDSEAAAEERKGYFIWECRCDCGNTVFVSTRSLADGNIKSCGCLNNERHLTGMRFGKLTVVRPIENGSGNSWQCKCDCGNTTFVTTANLTNGSVVSCGCLKKEIKTPNEKRPARDLTGVRFGRLTAIRPVEEQVGGLKSKKKPRFIFSRGAKLMLFFLGILYFVLAAANMFIMKETGSLNAYQIVRFVLLVGCDIASLVCIAIGKKKTEIAALILIAVFAITQYFTTLLM